MNKGVTWFKMFLSFAPLINAIPSQNVGDGVKAAMHYFKTGEEPEELGEMAFAVYAMLKDSIDQAFSDCERKSANAQKANAVRWGNIQVGSNLDPEKNQIRVRSEEEIRTEEDLISDTDCGALDKPARPPAPPVSVYTDPNTGKRYTLREYMERWHGVWKITDTTWKIVNSYRAKGLTDQLICFAFEQTVNANAEVEDAYFTTVLKDYLNAGFTTQEEAVAHEQSRNS